MRLTVAACLAVCIHAAIFGVEIPWSRPTMIVPLSRAVRIDLVTFDPPSDKPTPAEHKIAEPEPIPRPKPKPEPTRKPKFKPVITPHGIPVASRHADPPPAEPDPLPEDFFSPEQAESNNDLPEATSAAEPEAGEVANDLAAVQASVPLYDLNPPPAYPAVARRRNFQGTVILDVCVTTDGAVAQVRIAESSGYAILDRSAAKSVKAWRFSPARRAGHSIRMWVQVPVKFVLR